MRYCALVLTLIAVGYLATMACHKDVAQTTKSQPLDVPTVLRPVPAILNEDTLPPVAATEVKIKVNAGPFEFDRAQFVDENHGWAMSNNGIYRTTDGGNHWERLAQEPGKDAYFTSFSFVDESHGWLIIIRTDTTKSYGLGQSSDIMITTDGGTSWKLQATFPNEIQLRNIRFLNVNEGLAVGERGLENRVDRAELFVLGTVNGGKDWNDISGPAKAAFKNEWGAANDRGENIEWTPSSIVLLTQGGRIMRTTDRGKTWSTVVILKDERPEGFTSSTSFRKVALDPEEKFRVVAAATGDGYWGDFVVNEDGRWNSYELRLTPILDAVFLSQKDIVACGLNRRLTNEKSNLKDAGVVLRSFDNGRSWQTIYRSKSADTFFYLTKIKDNDFYAVSDTGTFLRFTLQQ